MKIPFTRLFFKACILLFFSFPLLSRAQGGVSTDELFQQARKAAFSGHDYPAAITFCKLALEKSPDYGDIRNFLGRLYAWSHFEDSAKQVLLVELGRHPDDEDAMAAMTDLENWNGHADSALAYCNKGLVYHPGSSLLLLKKAKILSGLSRYKESALITDTLLQRDPRNAEARALSQQTGSRSAKNQLGIYYDYVRFDKQYNDPWHLISVDYKRMTGIGAVIGRVNYANRFNHNGLQYEMDAYPRFSRVFYSYLNAGYSPDNGTFPGYRAGFSLYANLLRSFEAEAGFRYLYFGNDTWIYTFSAGKYVKNYWFNLRTYLAPGNNSISRSFIFTARYYSGREDYISLGLGTGISPDDRSNNVQLGSPYKLQSERIALGFNHIVKSSNVLLATATLIRQEYLPGTRGVQLDLGLGFQKRF